MPRRLRGGSGGQIVHVLNRGVRRSALFDGDADYRAFERLLVAAYERVAVTLFAFCLMSTHFHLVLRAEKDGNLSRFMRWLTVTHAQRRHAQKGSSGTGPVYQGRFKSFPIQDDRHFLNVCRYVERNPLRAGLVVRAEDWRWSSLWHYHNNSDRVALGVWPIPRSSAWVELVNSPRLEPDLEAIRVSVRTGRPFGELSWVEQWMGRR